MYDFYHRLLFSSSKKLYNIFTFCNCYNNRVYNFGLKSKNYRDLWQFIFSRTLFAIRFAALGPFQSSPFWLLCVSPYLYSRPFPHL